MAKTTKDEFKHSFRRSPDICLNAAVFVGFLCGCQRDASHISAEPCIYRRKISEEVTDMPRVLSFIGWLLRGLSFIGWLLRQAYLYWLAPPEDSLYAMQGWGGGGGGVGALPGWLGPPQIALSPVWEKHTTLFPPSEQRQTEFLLSLLSPSSPYFLSFVPLTSFSIGLPSFWPHDPFYTSCYSFCWFSEDWFRYFFRCKTSSKKTQSKNLSTLTSVYHLISQGLFTPAFPSF